jgi:uncharacterized membrane protein
MFNTDHFHPIAVHFPIAIITIGFIAEVASLFFKEEKCLSKTAFYLMVVGTLCAIVAWGTGQLFTQHPEEGAIRQVLP